VAEIVRNNFVVGQVMTMSEHILSAQIRSRQIMSAQIKSEQ